MVLQKRPRRRNNAQMGNYRVMQGFKSALYASVVASFAVVTGAGAIAQDLSGREIHLGAIVPSSGHFAEWGRTNTVTLKMIEDQVNAAGGINGAKLKLSIYDDAARPAQSTNALRKLAGDDKVLAVAGPLTSSACEVVFPVANQIGIVSTSQASSKPGVAKANRPWAFRNTIDEMVLARETVPYFKKAYDIKTVAVIYDAKDATANAVGTKIMPKLMDENGVKVLNADSLISFNTGDLDVSAQVTKLKSYNPDGVVVSADYSQAVTVIREMKRQGLDKPIVGSTQLISSAILKAAPELPIVAPTSFYVGMDTAAAKTFVAGVLPLLRAQKNLPAEVEPSMYDANIYEIVNMYIDAVKASGVTGKPEDLEADRVKIRDYMTKLKNFEGLAGPVAFNADGDAVKMFYIVEGKDGRWTDKAHKCSAPDPAACGL